MDSLQHLKTTIEAMLVITRNEADKPVGMGLNMWGLGYQQGIRAGYHSQATCLSMLLEQVELEQELLAEPGQTGMEDMSHIVPRALAEIQQQMELEKRAENSISAPTAPTEFPGRRSFFGSAKTRKHA